MMHDWDPPAAPPRSALWLAIAYVVLTWTVADPDICVPHRIAAWDAYLEGPGTGIVNATIGYRTLPAHTTSFTFGTGKMDPGCALGWQVTAVNADGTEAPPECQPTNLRADGIAWEGI